MTTAASPVAFVLSGGGSLGAIQVGMLHALYERGIKPHLIVATSVGAINGAFIASRPQIPETADELAARWRDVRRGQVFPIAMRGGLLGFLGTRAHLVPDFGLRALVSTHVGRDRLEKLPIPMHLVAVDVVTGEELLLSTGPLVEAILASAAIPAVLPSVAWEDRLLMDGAVANNTPISHAIRLGARVIYVLPAGHACALERPPRSPLGMALHALSLLMHSRLIADIELYGRGSAKLIVLPPPCPLAVTPIDFGHAAELIQRSLEDAREFLDDGGAERPPIRMRMHRHRRGKRVRTCAEAAQTLRPVGTPAASRRHAASVDGVLTRC
jgi:NTE family protein